MSKKIKTDPYEGISRSALELMCDEQKLKISELELKLAADELQNGELKLTVEHLKKDCVRHLNEIAELKRDKKDMQDAMNSWTRKQVARLEAVKMLWSIMEGANTHREKRQFYYQSIQVINEQIKALEDGCIINNDDLPF